MKRSDMIQTIKDYLDLIEGDEVPNQDKAEYILGGCCETLGMSPPEREYTDYNLPQWDNKIQTRTWEVEEEEDE